MSVLEIKNLCVEVDGRRIVNGVSLEVKTGEVHVIMGPNGSGKSTMALAIAGYSRYKTTGELLINKKNILKMTANGRAREGIFLAFQNPVSIPGVGVSSVLRMVKKEGDFAEFYDVLRKKSKELNLPEEFLRRPLNEDMSGGEKKKMEILQAETLCPKFIIFDEIDTGLDVDALKMIGEKINKMREKTGIIIITHYQRILRYVKPDFVHIIIGGKIVARGGEELGVKVEKEGYAKIN